MLKQYFEIRKVDEEQRMVFGYASTESVDAQGETVTKAAMEAAWDEYMQFANVREMHGPSAVGVVKEYSFDDKGVFIGAYIVDDAAWKKVTEQVYKGFSIGGKKLPNGYDAVNKTITGLKLTEISLVDRPANPDALVTMFKADLLENEEMTTQASDKPAAAVQADPRIAELLAKGDITVDRLLELVAQAAAAEAVAKAEETLVAPTAAPEKSALRKSFAALTATDGEDIKKGLYSVSELANLITNLRWIQSDCAYEAQSEGDGSALPTKLAQCVAALGDALVEMAREEVAELLANLQNADGMPAVELLDTLIANSASATDLKKFQDELDVVKAGARNSKSDLERIQTVHDTTVELGAECKQDDVVTAKADVELDVCKHDHGTDISKALGMVEKMSGELGTLRKSFDTLNQEHEELKKRFNDMPAPVKGGLRTIAKADDVNPELQTAVEVTPVLKQDGSVDEVATEIKKVYAGGGRQIFPIR